VITAENGQIVVIGGLIQTISSDENSSVPFLSEIPLLGELFKQKSEKENKTELVILLRPTITDDSVYESDIRESRERFGKFRDQMGQAPETNFYQ
jgi:MSHA biogenesis protein MshL